MIKNKKVLYQLIVIFIIVGWIFYKVIDVTYLQKQRTYEYGEMYLEDKDYFTAIDRFESINGFRDSEKRIQQIYKMMMEESIMLVNEGNLFDSNTLLNALVEIPEYKEEAETALKQVDELEEKYLEEKKQKLKYTAPYEGMSESDIEYSSWGPPTTIERDVNYDSYREDRRVEHYKWITKDQLGRITQIKTLMVKQGSVWGEPKISNYYVNQ